MRVLIAEDDRDLARQLLKALDAAGYVADAVANGEDAQHLGETEPYDAVILDLGLPLRDGLSVLRAWRGAGRAMPVLILTARDRWHEKVEGIDAGADDYLAKPFQMAELMARLRALIRRANGLSQPEMVCGDLRLDTRQGNVTLQGMPVSLTAQEYRILSYLMHHPGQVISRAQLTEHIYAQDFDRDSNTIEVFIGRLRKKLGADLIETRRGMGYRLAAPGEGGEDAGPAKAGP
ncbi:MAG: response regulator transcription factor [Sneathiellaceae bacterium]